VVGCLPLKFGGEVAVDVGGDLDATVAEDFADGPEGDALGEQQAGAVVAELVEGVGGKVGFATDSRELAVQVARVQDGADLAGEDVAGGDGVGVAAPCHRARQRALFAVDG
jgi:hypothetical protein